MVIQLNLFSGTNLIRERGCLDWSDAGRLAPNPRGLRIELRAADAYLRNLDCEPTRRRTRFDTSFSSLRHSAIWNDSVPLSWTPVRIATSPTSVSATAVTPAYDLKTFGEPGMIRT